MLVNHYHTQLIILRTSMRIPRCPSPPPLLLLPLFLMPLVLLHHFLVDTRWPHGDKACLSCAPQSAWKHRCRKQPRSTICHHPSKQMIKLASPLCVLPLDMDKQTQMETHLHKHIQHTQYVPGIRISVCVLWEEMTTWQLSNSCSPQRWTQKTWSRMRGREDEGNKRVMEGGDGNG